MFSVATHAEVDNNGKLMAILIPHRQTKNDQSALATIEVENT